jgi:hypothetical protein
MGAHPNINPGAGRFPKQGSHLYARVLVCFDYDTSRQFPGQIVRDDDQEPYRTIIALDDGPLVLATECHYSMAPATPTRPATEPRTP